MTTQEKKDYIKKKWSTSSGKMITKMLSHYWSSLHSEKSGKNEKKSSEEIAKEIGLI